MSIPDLIDKNLRPEAFFLRGALRLHWRSVQVETIAWEVYRGRLMDAAHTRQTGQYLTWNVFANDAPEPLLSVKWDEAKAQIHVVRAILSHAWEGYDAGGNVIESRETIRWVRELVGTIDLRETADVDDITLELRHLLSAAVRGTSRLPLTSVEAPLPQFALGQLDYLPATEKGVVTATDGLNWAIYPMEMLLRSLSLAQAPEAARSSVRQWPNWVRDCLTELREIFTGVSLTPYTEFVDTTIAFVQALTDMQAIAVEDEIDLWSWLLRQLGRHLTAYDLVTFHFRGANYPDALLLDAVLKRYLALVDARPDLFRGDGPGRRRRRALRQACLLRRHYEGHLVPDAPTSPGENARVLPPPHVRVPEEQLLNVMRRRKKLYAHEPLPPLLSAAARAVLADSIQDLAEPREWRELGMAVFIDRPFGWGKAVGEPDLTPLLAHEAYSPSLSRRRWRELEKLAGELKNETGPMPAEQEVKGLPADHVAEPDRPIVSLADARRVADDFVVLRTLPKGLRALTTALDLSAVEQQLGERLAAQGKRWLVARVSDAGHGSVIAIFDDAYRQRCKLIADLSQGFRTRSGVEVPVAGLRGLD